MDGQHLQLGPGLAHGELSNPDLYPLDLAAYILCEGESSRLVRKLKYEKQLVLSVDAESYTPHYVRGWFGVMATLRPEHWREAGEEILREVYRLRTSWYPAELAKAKKQKAAELVIGRQTVQEQAESLGRGYCHGGDPLFDQHYVEAFSRSPPSRSGTSPGAIRAPAAEPRDHRPAGQLGRQRRRWPRRG